MVWKTERAQLKAMDMPMKGAGLELRLYWFMEAKDPENMTPPTQAAATLAPTTSNHRERSMKRVSLR